MYGFQVGTTEFLPLLLEPFVFSVKRAIIFLEIALKDAMTTVVRLARLVRLALVKVKTPLPIKRDMTPTQLMMMGFNR